MKQLFLVMTMVLLLGLVGCGYQLQGGGYIKGNTRRVAVAVFQNKTAHAQAGVAFTNELVREIQEKTDTRVVSAANGIGQVEGTVVSITYSTASRSSSTNVVQRTVTARLNLRLVDGQGKVLWSRNGFSASEIYDVNEDGINDLQKVNEAVDRIARRSAERILSELMANF